MRNFQGKLSARDRRFGIVVSRFNEFITKRLLDAAVGELLRLGVAAEGMDTVWVPGAFEVPLACRKLAETGKVDAIIAMACVIRGETPHFEYVASALTNGVQTVALDCRIPVIYGALTCDSLEQAVQRAGGKMGNKGAEAARSAAEMVDLCLRLGVSHPEVQTRIRVINESA